MKNMYHVFFALFAASAAFGARVDLIDLTDDYIAQDGDILTGTLGGKLKISIADGAEVTLDNATIIGVNDGDNYQWAGITCLGNCTIVLSGSNIVKGFHKNYPGIQAAKQVGGVEEYTLTIKGDGSLDASSNGNGAGIGSGRHADCGNITISGGEVVAKGGFNAAGIGSGASRTIGDITISGGFITATGGEMAAGIGGGFHGYCGNITISGGFITATGVDAAAGIGSSAQGICGDITISGGEVAATGGQFAAGIGNGDGGSIGNITITNGVTSVVATGGTDAPYSVNAGGGSGAGTITIGGKVVDPITENPYEFVPVPVDLATLTSDYTAQDGDTLTGTLGGNYMISIADGAEVTLDNATIIGVNEGNNYKWAGITCLGNCTIVLKGTNTVTGFNGDYPGIQAAKNEGEGGEYTLTIKGDGSLEASSNGNGAGIGNGYQGKSGNITISGGFITATGGGMAAGIGSGNNGTIGDITISGGFITATGGDVAAGIGGGYNGTIGNITITNGVTSVVATKGELAPYSVYAGEGSGAGTITIGGKVVDPITESPFVYVPHRINLATLTADYVAQDGDTLTGTLGGNYMISIANDAKVTLKNATINGVNEGNNYKWAGITCLGNCTIVLKGSNTVKGFHRNYPGIQAAKNEGEGEEYTLTIEGDGSLDASSNGSGAGIGGGDKGSVGNITISGGFITATGGEAAAGIGGGYQGKSGNISISGGEVAATGDVGAAGIGSGYKGKSGGITISGGDVTAVGGYNAAGIGSGFEGSIDDITISGGEVVATGGEGAAGIGSGYCGTSGNITITNDVTKVVATKGEDADYSIYAGEGSGAGTITIGGTVMETSVAKELFVFPSTLVDIVDVGGKTYAIVDGDYSGEGALNIATDKNVDKVIFERTFPVVDGDNNYSTIMFPFAISADKVGNVKQAFKFLGIGVDKENRKVVTVEPVTNFEAYKPYLIQLESEKTSISIDNTEPLVLKAAPTADGAYDVEQSEGYNQYGDYVFHGVVQTKTWSTGDPDLAEGGAAYGFAGTAGTDVSVGQFVKVGEGAFIKPLRGYIYKKQPKKVKANGAYVLRQTASVDDDLPDVMNVVVVDRKKDGGEQTTVIGQFNSRTGEFRLNRTKRTYDLKGRSVRDASRKAKGVYFKK